MSSIGGIFEELGAGLGEANAFVAKYLLGFALGTAAAPALTPFAQSLANEAWKLNQTVPPLAYILAEGVAQGQVTDEAARGWAHEQGFGDPQWDALVNIANVGPGVAVAFELWRRGVIEEPGFRRAVKRLGLEQEWIDDLVKVKNVLLDPSVIATAVHRGIMRDPTLIVTEPPTTPGKVEQVPISPLDPATEAAGHGLTHERLRIEVGTTGLPPGLMEMLHLLNLDKVTVDDVQRAVAQSNLRNEYMDVVLALRRRLLTPHEYEEAALRGLIGRSEADDGAALSGMEKADAELLFETMGRPLTVHQLVTALARGGTYGGTYDDIPEPYRDAVRRSNIRPEYAVLAHANRYTLPSAFVMRALTQDKTWSAAKAERRLLEAGWIPEDAKEAADKWAAGTGVKANPYVAKADTQLWNTVHASYKAEEATATDIAPALALLGLDATVRTEVLARWDAERALIRQQLSPADLRKAYQEAILNPATGVPWTQADALAQLLDRGWSHDDAMTYLLTPHKG